MHDRKILPPSQAFQCQEWHLTSLLQHFVEEKATLKALHIQEWRLMRSGGVKLKADAFKDFYALKFSSQFNERQEFIYVWA